VLKNKKLVFSHILASKMAFRVSNYCTCKYWILWTTNWFINYFWILRNYFDFFRINADSSVYFKNCLKPPFWNHFRIFVGRLLYFVIFLFLVDKIWPHLNTKSFSNSILEKKRKNLIIRNLQICYHPRIIKERQPGATTRRKGEKIMKNIGQNNNGKLKK